MTISYNLRPFDLFYGRLVYVVAIGYIIPILVNCTKKNLATLAATQDRSECSLGLPTTGRFAPITIASNYTLGSFAKY
jgi:hypothetical protein